jgi:hypothetical protein
LERAVLASNFTEIRSSMADLAVAQTKRINLNLAMKSYQDLERLAQQTGRTMTDIVRFGLALVKLYSEETAKGRKLVIASENGKAISEIRFPD